MVKVVFANNAGAAEKIVDETKSVRTILNEAGFTYEGASLNIDGRAIPAEFLDESLTAFINPGTTNVRITAVAHKSQA